MYTCRIFLNSGFNKNNIPDSPALLHTCSYIDVPALDILQDKFLPGVSVKATYQQVENADYVQVGSCYYFVSGGIRMTSTDVAYIPLLMDYITTGGLSNLTVLDGITERVHVAVADDVFGAFPEKDELMAPVHPMKLVAGWSGYDREYMTLIETVLDMEAIGSGTDAVTYTDATSGETVTVPHTSSATHTADYYIDDGTPNMRKSDSTGTTIYQYAYSAGPNPGPLQPLISTGVEKCFDLGIENGGIIQKVRLPYRRKVNGQTENTIDITFYSTISGACVDKLVSKPQEWNLTGLDFIFSNQNNMKLNYSEYCQYGLMTAAGETMECDASTVFDYQAQTTPTAPTVMEYDDPHLDGRPYYRFGVVNGDKSFEGFWRNCVKGLPWKAVPVIFTQKQGSVLDTLNYNMDAKVQQDTRGFAHVEERMGIFSSAFNAGSSFATAVGTGSLQGIPGALNDLGRSIWEHGKAETMYEDSRLKQAQDFALSQNVVQPQVHFPFNAETVRDFLGNGVLVYRYIYDPFDEQRINRLLNMYGYKHTKNLELTDFFTRDKFNYVKASNVSFGGNFPAWLLNGAATQVSGGVRVWHVLPNTSYYVSGNN